MRITNSILISTRVLEIIDTHIHAEILGKSEFGAWQISYKAAAQANIDMYSIMLLAINAQPHGHENEVVLNTAAAQSKVDDLMTNLVLEAFATGNKTIPGSPEYEQRRSRLCLDVVQAFQVAIEKIPHVLRLDSSQYIDPVVSLMDDAIQHYNRDRIVKYDDILGALSEMICAVLISRTSYWKDVDFFGDCVTEI